MKQLFAQAGFFSAVLVAVTGGSANAQEGSFGYGVKHENVVIRDARVFSGCSAQLADADVLVTGNMIARIAPDVEAPEGALEINADALFAGLRHAEVHTAFTKNIGYGR